MATLATAVIQDLTYTEKSLGLDVTITYTNDGVAGSEVVSVLNHAISIKIQSGVSTATQIRAAIVASLDASALVTVTVSGTGTNVQVSCVNAPIANGSVALAASKQIGGILYTAKTAGTAGNSIRIKYEHHLTNLTAVAAGDDITVTFNSGVTKMSAIMATIRADSACNALVSVAQTVPDSEQLIAYAVAFVNLAGGAAAVAGSVVVQDLTYSSDAINGSRNGSKITYTVGATAGAEVVTVVVNDVSIQIENGVSSATQIKAAFDASASADGAAAAGSIIVSGYASLAGATVTVAGHVLTEGAEWTAATDDATTAESLKDAIHALTEVNATRTSVTVNIVAASKGTAGNAITLATSDAVRLLKSGATLTGGTDKLQCTISGTGGTAQKVVSAKALSGGTGDGARAKFVSQATLTLTSAYQLVSFGFTSRQLSIINDESTGSNAVIYSYDGITAHGQVDPSEAITLDNANTSGIFLKYGTGAPAYKVMASAL